MSLVKKESERIVLQKTPNQCYDDRLLPCPFCGGKAILGKSDRYPQEKRITGYSVFCENHNCIIAIADSQYAKTEKEIIDIWNNRVTAKENR